MSNKEKEEVKMRKYLMEVEILQGPRCGRRWYEVRNEPADGIMDGVSVRPVATVDSDDEALHIVRTSEGSDAWLLEAVPFFEAVIDKQRGEV